MRSQRIGWRSKLLAGLAVISGVAVGSLFGLGVAQAADYQYATSVYRAQGVPTGNSPTFEPLTGGRMHVYPNGSDFINVTAWGQTRSPGGTHIAQGSIGPNAWGYYQVYPAATGNNRVWWSFGKTLNTSYALSGKVVY